MRYLYNNIIKSTNVSLGKKAVQIDSEMPKVIKRTGGIKNTVMKSVGAATAPNQNGVNELNPEPATEEEIRAKYMEEARKKSELFFQDEMKKAYAEGLKKAEAEANGILDEAQAQANQIISEAEQVKKDAEAMYKDTVANLEPQIISLSVDIAKKVINKEIAEDSEYIIGIVKDTLLDLTSKKGIILKVSDKDYTTIIGNMDILLAQIPGFNEVEIVKESSLKDGSCVLDTDYGTIDGSLETRVSKIQEGILKLLNS